MPNLPQDIVTIRTQEKLKRHLDNAVLSWSTPNPIKFLMLIGPPGKGKTELSEQAIKDAGIEDYFVVKGRQSAPDFYAELYSRRTSPIILDDVLSMACDKQFLGLLQQATDTGKSRIVRWGTKNCINDSEGEGVPKSYEVESPFIVILNEWDDKNAVIRSISDRAHNYNVNPSNDTTHFDYVPTWYALKGAGSEANLAVYEVIEEYLDYIPQLTCRYYTRGVEKYFANPTDWRQEVIDMILPDEHYEEIMLRKIINEIPKQADQIKEARTVLGISDATFKRRKKALGLSRPYKSTSKSAS